MTAEEDLPIETLQDVFESGLPWHITEYGSVVSVIAASPPDSELVKFFNGRDQNLVSSGDIFEMVNVPFTT